MCSSLVLAAVLGCAGGASASPAEGGAPASPRAAQAQPSPDFLFGRPQATLGLRGSWLLARAGSDVFDFVQELLTVERGDFDAPAFALDAGIPVTSRLDALVGFEISRALMASEYRDFEENGLPITQETRLRQFSLTAGARLGLVPRGREIGRFAWVPRRVAPYVGVGAGLVRYELLQEGDFVDFADLSIFTARLRSSGWTPGAHVFGGTDLRLARRTYLALEARYVWASADLGRDFAGFDPIDLAGLRIGAGFTFLF